MSLLPRVQQVEEAPQVWRWVADTAATDLLDMQLHVQPEDLLFLREEFQCDAKHKCLTTKSLLQAKAAFGSQVDVPEALLTWRI